MRSYFDTVPALVYVEASTAPGQCGSGGRQPFHGGPTLKVPNYG